MFHDRETLESDIAVRRTRVSSKLVTPCVQSNEQEFSSPSEFSRWSCKSGFSGAISGFEIVLFEVNRLEQAQDIPDYNFPWKCVEIFK